MLHFWKVDWKEANIEFQNIDLFQNQSIVKENTRFNKLVSDINVEFS